MRRRPSAAHRAVRAALGRIDGLPVGLKDIIDLAGHPTTCHSRHLLDNVKHGGCGGGRRGCAPPARCSRPSSRRMNSPSAGRPSTCPSRRRATRGTRRIIRAARPPARASSVGRGHPAGGARHRHRRLGAPPGQPLRHRRHEADLRAGLAPRRLPAGLHARPCRADDARRGVQRACCWTPSPGMTRPTPAVPRVRAENYARALQEGPAGLTHRLRAPLPRDRPAGHRRGRRGDRRRRALHGDGRAPR